MPTGKLRGRLEKKDIGKSGVATFAAKRPQPPCICGRPTYRLNAELAEVCTGCNEAICVDCKPVTRSKPVMMRG